MITTSDQSYTAQSGETLSTIAEKVYETEELSTLIYGFNRDAIGENPEHIEQGTRLVVPLQTSQNFTNRIELTNIERRKAGLRDLNFISVSNCGIHKQPNYGIARLF